MLWRPAFEPTYSEVNCSLAVGIGCGLSLCMQFGDLHFDGHTCTCPGEMRHSFDYAVLCAAEMEVVLIDEGIGDCDDGGFARDSAVVPPIGFKGGDIVFAPGIIDRGNDEVIAGMHGFCDVAVEGGESAFVLADFFAVDPPPGVVIGCADVQESARMLLRLVSEVTLVPDGAFIEEERFALCVPVAGDFELGGFVEVVFGWAGIIGLRLAIQEPAVLLLFMMKAEEAGEIRIDDRGPVAIERELAPAVSSLQSKRSIGRLRPPAHP